eukprot:g16062.t1
MFVWRGTKVSPLLRTDRSSSVRGRSGGDGEDLAGLGVAVSSRAAGCGGDGQSEVGGISNPTQDLPHNVPAAIGHVATVGEPTDDVTSATARYTTSVTANAIDTAADATTSISEANTTDTEDTPT